MKPTFYRVPHPDGRRELLLNVGSILRIEVQNVDVDAKGDGWSRLLPFGQEDPNALRIYDVFFAGLETAVRFEASDSPMFKIVEDIFKNAIT